MRVMNSHGLTIFQGVKIEVALFMMGPNEESMEACSSAWFGALWMREGIEVPTMVESHAFLGRRVRCVLIPSTKFECC